MSRGHQSCYFLINLAALPSHDPIRDQFPNSHAAFIATKIYDLDELANVVTRPDITNGKLNGLKEN